MASRQDRPLANERVVADTLLVTQGAAAAEAKTAVILKRLEDGISQILEGEAFAAYLQVMSRFHRYSFGNVMLITMQCPEATQVAGYQRWKELNRFVRRGEKAIKILVPYRSRVEIDGEELFILRGFGVGNVFDVSQTDGEPLPPPPTVAELRESSTAGRWLWQQAERLVAAEGLRLVRADTKPARGWYSPTHCLIAVDVDLDGDQAAKTLIHELAHHLAEHRGYVPRADAETVAEGAAYVVLQHCGIDASGYSFGYVASWSQDTAVLKRNLAGIQKTASLIIDALALQPSAPSSAG